MSTTMSSIEILVNLSFLLVFLFAACMVLAVVIHGQIERYQGRFPDGDDLLAEIDRMIEERRH